MPRIRTIKPVFWSTPNPPSRDARLLYIAMWNWCDDEGVGTANPKELAAFAFPYDDDMDSREVQGLLSEISVSFQCVFYTVGGRPYYSIENFGDHQVINRPTPSKHPKPDQAEKWLYQQELSDHGGLTESAVSTPIPEVGNRKKEIGITSGYVQRQRPESNARDDERPRDRMGRPEMNLGVLSGVPEVAPVPPPPDRHVPSVAVEIVNAVVPQEILSSHKIGWKLKTEVATLVNGGAERSKIEATLREWLDRDGAFPGDLQQIYTDVCRRERGPLQPRNGTPVVASKKDQRIARTLSKKTDNSSNSLLNSLRPALESPSEHE